MGNFSCDVNEGRIEQIARLIGLQRQRIAAQEQLHRQEVQALDTAIGHTQRQIRLAQTQRTQQNRLTAKAVVGSADPAE